MYPVQTTLPEGLVLNEGDKADLRVEIRDGAIVVTKILSRTPSAVPGSDYKVKLGTWNRK